MNKKKKKGTTNAKAKDNHFDFTEHLAQQKPIFPLIEPNYSFDFTEMSSPQR